jgi:hypothetical protein
VVKACSFRTAADILEDAAAGGPPVTGTLSLRLRSTRGPAVRGRDGDDGGGDPRDFARFVAALARGGGGGSVRNLVFRGVDWQSTSVEETGRLLGEVLPHHPALESVTFFQCGFSLPLLERFASSVPAAGAAATTTTTRLASVHFEGRQLDREQAGIIADMVRRNACLSTLVIAGGLGLDAGSCQLLCQSLPGNTTLRVLDVLVHEVFANTLDSVATAASSSSSWLRDLTVRVYNPISDECVESLARQLRTNTTMTRLRLLHANADPLTDRPDHLFRPIEDVLDTYNFALAAVTVAPPIDGPPSAQCRIDGLVRRNQRIKRALWMWQRPSSSRAASPAGLWPQLLAPAGILPTLLYRLVRHGDANELCQLLVSRRHRTTCAKKRGRTASAAHVGGEEMGRHG